MYEDSEIDTFSQRSLINADLGSAVTALGIRADTKRGLTPGASAKCLF